MEHILREIKLSKLTNTPMGDKASRLNKFWDGLWVDMKVRIDTDEGKIECWKDGYKYYYFLQRDKDDLFWCDFYRVWPFFHDEFKLNNNEIKEVIQTMMGEFLNCKVNTPWVGITRHSN